MPDRRRVSAGLAALLLGTNGSVRARSGTETALEPSVMNGPHASQAIQDAVAQLTRMGGTLRFPPGSYSIRSSSTIFDISDANEITIEGTDTTLIFDGSGPPFRLERVHNFKMKNINISWPLANASRGDVFNVNIDGRVFDVHVDIPLPIPNRSSVLSAYRYDRVRRAPSVAGREISWRTIKNIQHVAPRIIRIEVDGPVIFEEGDTVLFKLRHPQGSPLFRIRQSRDVKLENVQVHQAPQMAFVAVQCENIDIVSLTIEADHRSGGVLASGADGIHLVECSGVVRLERCRILDLGDDCINAHAFFFQLVAILDPFTVLVSNRTVFSGTQFELDRQQFGLGVEDEIELVSEDTMQIVGRARVVQVWPTSGGLILRLDRRVTVDRSRQFLVCSQTDVPSISIKNCHLGRTRARGAVVHARASVEDCVFEDIALAGVLGEADAYHWGEGCSISALRIRGNRFVRCGLSGSAAVSVRSVGRSGGRAAPAAIPVGVDAQLSENSFVSCRTAISINGVDGVELSRNNVLSDSIEQSANPMIVVTGSRNINVSGNSSDRPISALLNAVDGSLSFVGNTRISLR